ncbi:MAG: hypothetical protein LBM95_00060 [Lactobacillales bacterium]|nr:hypothetical protein [Lactobacillales bacterium]
MKSLLKFFLISFVSVLCFIGISLRTSADDTSGSYEKDIDVRFKFTYQKDGLTHTNEIKSIERVKVTMYTRSYQKIGNNLTIGDLVERVGIGSAGQEETTDDGYINFKIPKEEVNATIAFPTANSKDTFISGMIVDHIDLVFPVGAKSVTNFYLDNETGIPFLERTKADEKVTSSNKSVDRNGLMNFYQASDVNKKKSPRFMREYTYSPVGKSNLNSSLNNIKDFNNDFTKGCELYSKNGQILHLFYSIATLNKNNTLDYKQRFWTGNAATANKNDGQGTMPIVVVQNLVLASGATLPYIFEGYAYTEERVEFPDRDPGHNPPLNNNWNNLVGIDNSYPPPIFPELYHLAGYYVDYIEDTKYSGQSLTPGNGIGKNFPFVKDTVITYVYAETKSITLQAEVRTTSVGETITWNGKITNTAKNNYDTFKAKIMNSLSKEHQYVAGSLKIDGKATNWNSIVDFKNKAEHDYTFQTKVVSGNEGDFAKATVTLDICDPSGQPSGQYKLSASDEVEIKVFEPKLIVPTFFSFGLTLDRDVQKAENFQVKSMDRDNVILSLRKNWKLSTTLYSANATGLTLDLNLAIDGAQKEVQCGEWTTEIYQAPTDIINKTFDISDVSVNFPKGVTLPKTTNPQITLVWSLDDTI